MHILLMTKKYTSNHFSFAYSQESIKIMADNHPVDSSASHDLESTKKQSQVEGEVVTKLQLLITCLPTKSWCPSKARHKSTPLLR
jgi:hypothetical protein